MAVIPDNIGRLNVRYCQYGIFLYLVFKVLHRGFQNTSNRTYLAVLMAQNFRRKL
jgi:hypothetical protein